MVWVSRGLVLGIGLVGYYIALREPPTVFAIVVFATSVLGSAFLPAYVCAVWWRKANTPGAITSMIMGASVSFLWSSPLGLEEASGLHSMLAGVLTSTVTMIVVSLMTQQFRPPPAHVVEAMDEAARVRPIPEALLSKFG